MNPRDDAALASALAPALAALGLLPVDVTLTTAGTRRVLRVLVDRDLTGATGVDPSDTTSRVAPLSLDEVADATRAVTETLDGPDGDDLMGERAYTLEVSSPGVGRTLTGHDALRRNVGRLVALTLASGDVLTARLVAVGADAVVVEVAAARRTPAERRTLALSEIRSGQVQVEFTHHEVADVEDQPDDLPDDLADDEVPPEELDDEEEED